MKIELKKVKDNFWVFNEVHEAGEERCEIPFLRAMLVDHDEQLRYIGEWWFFYVPDPESDPQASPEEWKWYPVLKISRTERQFTSRDPDEWEVCFLLHRQAQSEAGLPGVIPSIIRDDLEQFLGTGEPLEQAA